MLTSEASIEDLAKFRLPVQISLAAGAFKVLDVIDALKAGMSWLQRMAAIPLHCDPVKLSPLVVQTALGLILSMTLVLAARAAPEEIQVYQDDLSNPGQFGVDVHQNYVLSGKSGGDYAGAEPSLHTYRLTPEFYLGITKNLEAGFYILSSVTPDGTVAIDGEKARLKFIAPRPSDQKWYWGANLEVGEVRRRFDQNPGHAEMKGIFGGEAGPFVYAVNGNIDWTLSGPKPAPVSFEMDTKLNYKLSEKLQAGVETYNGAGPFKALGPLKKNDQFVYAGVDFNLAGHDVNLGLGRNLTNISDGWVAKVIIGSHF